MLSALCLIGGKATALAQNRGYEKAVEISVAPDLSLSETVWNASFINGFRFNKHIFLGGGIGLNMYTYGETVRIAGGSEVTPSALVSVPVFAAFKVNFSKARVSPFFSLNAGYAIGSSSDDNIDVTGLYLNPSIGLDINLGSSRKCAIIVKGGVEIQENKNLLTWERDNPTRARIKLGVGIRF